MSGSKKAANATGGTGKAVPVHIVYRSKFKSLSEALEREFPNMLKITNETSKDKKTVVFEVYVGGSGGGDEDADEERELIHSKVNGDGFVDGTEKMEKIFNAIRKLLPEQKDSTQVSKEKEVKSDGDDNEETSDTGLKIDESKTTNGKGKGRGRKRKLDSNPASSSTTTSTTDAKPKQAKSRTQPKRGN